MEFRVLGSLEVSAAGQPVAIGTAPKRRLALAALLARAGQPVLIDTLVAAVWGERPPASARPNLQLYVNQLRRVMGAELITARAGGYLVDPGDDLDATRFRLLVAEGGSALATGDPVIAEARLRAGLDLWRGPAFAEFLDCPLVAEEAARLELLRLECYERWAEAQLATGATPVLAGELAELCRQHPYRETSRAHLMRALYQTGRQAEALAVFREARALLANELGVEPGPELQRLHQAMLRGDETLMPPAPRVAPRATAVPHELPPDPIAFTGREPALGFLDQSLPDPDRRAPPVVVSGMGGVGKTALAVYWGHRVADRFPDGQLYVNLRGYAATAPMPPVEALGRLLRALGVPSAQVPVEVDAAAGMFRTRLTGRRVLVVLDNARDAEQVRPLLPATPGCLALVTSRDRLTGLVARDGARRLTLGVLAPAEAARLLTRLLGHADPRAAVTLARACGRLPLAIRIAASYLADRPGLTTAAYAEALRSTLDGLEVDGDPEASIRSTFAHSYHALDPASRRLFRLLGLVPGHDLTPPAAAALADTDPDQARRPLDTLARAHLVDPSQPGRYVMHDLLRAYAGELATADIDPEVKDAAARLHDFYLSAVDTAVNMVYPRAARLPVDLPDPFPHRTTFPDPAAAVAWLDAEIANLVAMIEHTAAHGPRRVAWLLADALDRYFWHRRRHGAEWLATAEAGLAAAEADGHQLASAAAHLGISRAHRHLGRMASAVWHATRALTISRQLGWPEGQASALTRLGVARAELGHNKQALAAFDEALAINQQIAQPASRAEPLTNRSALRLRMGHLQKSVQDGLAAAESYRASPDPAGEAYAHLNTAASYLYLGALDRANNHITDSLRLFNSIGERHGQNRARLILAKIHCDARRYPAALECATTTLHDALQVDDHASAALSLIDLVTIRHHQGDHQHAVRDSARAVQQARRAGRDRPYAEVQALLSLADAYYHDGQLDRALTNITTARRITQRYGYRLLEGYVLTVLGEIQLAAGDRTAATENGKAALAIHRESGYQRGVARAHALLEQPAPAGPDGKAAAPTTTRSSSAVSPG